MSDQPNIDSVPVATTPTGGWDAWPDPVLAGCTEPVPEGAPDLDGYWLTVEVLVEGPSKASAKQGVEGDVLQLTGRTHCDRIVVFTGNRRQTGEILPIGIYDANAHTLFGEVMTTHAGPELYALEH